MAPTAKLAASVESPHGTSANVPNARIISFCGNSQSLGLPKVPSRAVASHSVLFNEGEAATDLFELVEGGVVKLYKVMADGRCQVTGFVYPFRLFGLSLNNQYITTAETIGDCVVRCYSRALLERALEANPALISQLLVNASEELSFAQEQMLLLGRRTARERVAWFLLTLARRGTCDVRPASEMQLPMPQQDIGDYLGLSSETVCRVLQDLKREGMIEIPSARVVTLLRPDQLHQVADREDDFSRSPAPIGTTRARWPT